MLTVPLSPSVAPKFTEPVPEPVPAPASMSESAISRFPLKSISPPEAIFESSMLPCVSPFGPLIVTLPVAEPVPTSPLGRLPVASRILSLMFSSPSPPTATLMPLLTESPSDTTFVPSSETSPVPLPIVTLSPEIVVVELLLFSGLRLPAIVISAEPCGVPSSSVAEPIVTLSPEIDVSNKPSAEPIVIFPGSSPLLPTSMVTLLPDCSPCEPAPICASPTVTEPVLPPPIVMSEPPIAVSKASPSPAPSPEEEPIVTSPPAISTLPAADVDPSCEPVPTVDPVTSTFPLPALIVMSPLPAPPTVPITASDTLIELFTVPSAEPIVILPPMIWVSLLISLSGDLFVPISMSAPLEADRSMFPVAVILFWSMTIPPEPPVTFTDAELSIRPPRMAVEPTPGFSEPIVTPPSPFIQLSISDGPDSES